MNQKIVNALRKKCETSGMDYDQAVLAIEQSCQNLGLTEDNAYLLWMSNNNMNLRRTKTDLKKVMLLYYDPTGKEVKKADKVLTVHEGYVLANFEDAAGIETNGILDISLWEGGDKGDSLFLEDFKKMAEGTVFSATKVSIDHKSGKLFMGQDTVLEIAKDPVNVLDFLKSANPPYVSSAMDNLDRTNLFRGSVVKVAKGKDGNIGLELGHIPEDSDDIPSPVMVWFPPDDKADLETLKQMEGTEIYALCRFYVKKKDSELGAQGYSVFQ